MFREILGATVAMLKGLRSVKSNIFHAVTALRDPTYIALWPQKILSFFSTPRFMSVFSELQLAQILEFCFIFFTNRKLTELRTKVCLAFSSFYVILKLWCFKNKNFWHF